MLPNKMPIADRFQMARDCGFEEIECPTTRRRTRPKKSSPLPQGQAPHPLRDELRALAQPPLFRRPRRRRKEHGGHAHQPTNAKLWGADTVLLVPAVVNPETTYAQAWERSQSQIRKLIPMAEELKVIIGIEEVWNKFLLSPLEFARYIDEFKTPWIRAYFDVGNVAINGYPQDWIRTLDKRIVKVHFKDFVFENAWPNSPPCSKAKSISWPSTPPSPTSATRARHGGTLRRRRRLPQGSQHPLRKDPLRGALTPRVVIAPVLSCPNGWSSRLRRDRYRHGFGARRKVPERK